MDVKSAESKSRAIKVLIGSIIIVAISYGTMNVQSLYIAPICAQTGAELTQVSLLFSVITAASAIGGLVAAVLIEKIPMRILLYFGTACYVLFFVCLYFADSLPLVYLGAVFYGLCQVFVGFTTLQPLVTWWHAKDTAKKVSFLSIGMKLAAVILSPTIVWFLSNVGYDGTLLFNGGVLGVVMLLAVIFLTSNKPESYGLVAWGHEESADTDHAAGEPEGISAKQAMRTLPFWAVLLASILISIPVAGFVTNAAVIFQSCGFDDSGAGIMISVFSALSIATVFIYGALTDKFGTRLANMSFTIASIVCVAGFLVTDGMVAAVFISLAGAVLSAYSGMIAAVTFGPLFGSRAIGPLVSVGLVACGVGSTIAPPVASSIFTSTGSYWGFMAISLVICFVVLVLLLAATSKKSFERVAAIKPE